MKTLTMAILLASSFARAEIKFIEVKDFRETEGLPPKLELVFDIQCNQKFLSVIRQDLPGASAATVQIAVGGLVEQSTDVCSGQTEKTISAGETFSGRHHEIIRIQNH